MSRSVYIPQNAEGIAYYWIGDDDIDDRWLEDIIDRLKEKFPTLDYVEDRWLEREVRIIGENGLVYITASEYNGLVAICVVPIYGHNEWDYRDKRRANLSYAYAGWVKNVLDEMSQLSHVGTFSNGEAVFKQKNDGWYSSKEGYMEWMS